MGALQLEPRKQNFFQFRPPLFDFEFRREGDEVVLAFSAKKEVPRELLVRLYETRATSTRVARRIAVAEDVGKRLLGDGLAKSNRFVVADGVQTLEDIAGQHGFDDARALLDHFRNRLLKSVRGSDIQQGDLVFVPQLVERDAIALGPLLPVEDVGEAVEDGGHRHQARWNIVETAYDPLDPEAWVGDSLMIMGPSEQPVSDVLDREASKLWLPQFAVVTTAGELVDVSLSPPEIVESVSYALTADDPHVLAVLLRKDSRFVSADASTVTFSREELPLGVYGAFPKTEA